MFSLRVKADGGDEGAEEGLGLGVAARLQQGPPVLGAGHHLPFKAAVAQEVGQPHLGVAHILAHLHLVGNGHATGGLSQIEDARQTRPGKQSHGNEDEDESGHCGRLALLDWKSRRFPKWVAEMERRVAEELLAGEMADVCVSMQAVLLFL